MLCVSQTLHKGFQWALQINYAFYRRNEPYVLVIISVDHDTTDIDVINTVEYLQAEIQPYIMVVISIDNVTLVQTSAL